jgi:hypothetical protein
LAGQAQPKEGPAMRAKWKFKFAGRGGNIYYWEAFIPGDSRAYQISCNVDWFWGRK